MFQLYALTQSHTSQQAKQNVKTLEETMQLQLCATGQEYRRALLFLTPHTFHLMRTLSILSLVLLTLAFTGCSHHKCQDPTPKCYAGVVVGDACLDGVLIEVEGPNLIGKPAGTWGTNVIAAVNFEDFTGLSQVGKRVYFTFRNDPARQRPVRNCTANTVPLPVPHLLLSNLSATACTAGRSN